MQDIWGTNMNCGDLGIREQISVISRSAFNAYFVGESGSSFLGASCYDGYLARAEKTE